METNIEEKILRFAELSREFSEKPEELDKYPENCTSQFVTGTSNIGYIQVGYSYTTVGTPESPLERFKKDKKKEIKKAERWYEYVELRNNIEDYFKAKHKLNK